MSATPNLDAVLAWRAGGDWSAPIEPVAVAGALDTSPPAIDGGWPTDPAARISYAIHRSAASGAPARCPSTWVVDRDGRRLPAPTADQRRPKKAKKRGRKNR